MAMSEGSINARQAMHVACCTSSQFPTCHLVRAVHNALHRKTRVATVHVLKLMPEQRKHFFSLNKLNMKFFAPARVADIA
jgi:hypothetical protein